MMFKQSVFVLIVTAPDDSSSEETQSSSTNMKPAIPPRPRNLAYDHKSKLLNNSNIVKQRGSYETTEFVNLDGNTDRKLIFINIYLFTKYRIELIYVLAIVYYFCILLELSF